jgi:hypothetical protein
MKPLVTNAALRALEAERHQNLQRKGLLMMERPICLHSNIGVVKAKLPGAIQIYPLSPLKLRLGVLIPIRNQVTILNTNYSLLSIG